MRTLLFITALLCVGCDSTPRGDAGASDTDAASADAGNTASDEAIAYCTGYSAVCTYSSDANRFDDERTCARFYDAASAACRACLATHQELAGTEPATHCPHAMGMGPCEGDC